MRGSMWEWRLRMKISKLSTLQLMRTIGNWNVKELQINLKSNQNLITRNGEHILIPPKTASTPSRKSIFSRIKLPQRKSCLVKSER